MTDDLEFDEQEIFTALMKASLTPEEDTARALTVALNAILAAKLEKARQVMGYDDGVTWHAIELRESADDYTHRARLVCIEKLEGK